MISETAIRAPVPGDHSAWLAMRCLLWPHGSEEEHAGDIRAYHENPNVTVFLAFDGSGEASGFVEASLRSHAEDCRSRPVGYLEGIFVMPGHRGQGIGRALVMAAQQWALSRGCMEMASDCLHDNDDSIRFHRRVGFEVVDTLVHFRRPLNGQA